MFNLEYSNGEIVIAGQVFGTPDFDKSSNIVRGTQAAPNFVARYSENLDYIDHFFLMGTVMDFMDILLQKKSTNQILR